MITLCEWHVVVDVPDDFVESEADTLSAAVMTSLAERAVGDRAAVLDEWAPVRIHAES